MDQEQLFQKYLQLGQGSDLAPTEEEAVEEPQQAATLPPEQADALFEKYMKLAVDENTGEAKPKQVLGVDPDSAMNESVVDLTDRVKLSLGDKMGQVAYLKEKYEDATLNSKGDLTVKKDGNWFLVDPKGYEFSKDPWKLSKEIIADNVADMTGTGIIAAAAVAGGIAGTAMAPGVGTAGGAVTGAGAGEYLRSSLGRLVGTYTADPVQQTKDIAFESMMQLAGEKFVPGMKKGLDVIGDGVEKLGLRMKVEEGARAVGRFYSQFNVGQQAMDTIMTYGKEVNQRMKDVFRASGNNDAKYIEFLQSDSINQVKNLAAKAPRILSNTYQKMQQQIMDAVPDTFKSNIRTTAIEAYAKTIDDGLAKVVRSGQEIADKAEIVKIMRFAQEQGRLPKGTSVMLKTPQELASLAKRTGQFDNNVLKLATDPEAYELLNKMYRNVDLALASKQLQGKDAAKAMLSFKREMGDVIWGLSTKADDMGLNSLRKSFETYSKIIDDNTKTALDQVGQGQMYSQMNAKWSQLSRELKPLANAHVTSMRTGSDTAFETFLNKVKSVPGRNQLSKSSLESIEIAADQLGDQTASQMIKGARTALEINDAAAAFNPYVNRPSVGDVGIGAFGLLTGQWAIAAAVGVKKAIGSPQLTKSLVNTSQNMWQSMNWLKSQSADTINLMLKDPKLASAFINTQVEATAVQSAMEKKLVSMIDPEKAAQMTPMSEEMMRGAQAAQSKDLPKDRQLTEAQIRKARVEARIRERLAAVQIETGQENPSAGAHNVYEEKLAADQRGGASFGLHQMSAAKGVVQEYVKNSKFKEEFEGLDPIARPEEFAKVWEDVARHYPDEFAEEQMDYIDNKHPSLQTMKKHGAAAYGDWGSIPSKAKAFLHGTGVNLSNIPAQRYIAAPLKDLAKGLISEQTAIEEMALRRMEAYYAFNKVGKNAGVFDGLVNRTVKEPLMTLYGMTYKQAPDLQSGLASRNPKSRDWAFRVKEKLKQLDKEGVSSVRNRIRQR